MTVSQHEPHPHLGTDAAQWNSAIIHFITVTCDLHTCQNAKRTNKGCLFCLCVCEVNGDMFEAVDYIVVLTFIIQYKDIAFLHLNIVPTSVYTQ